MFGHYYQCLKGVRDSVICRGWAVQIFKWGACASRRTQHSQEDRYAGPMMCAPCGRVLTHNDNSQLRCWGCRTMTLLGCRCMAPDTASVLKCGELNSSLRKKSVSSNSSVVKCRFSALASVWTRWRGATFATLSK